MLPVTVIYLSGVLATLLVCSEAKAGEPILDETSAKGHSVCCTHAHPVADNHWLFSPGPEKAPTGWGNMGIGNGALLSVTKGYLNSTIGFEAGRNFQNANNNVALGAYAARAGVGPLADSVWVGARAGQDTVSGVGDTAIGFRSMQKVNVARNNTALGDSTFFVHGGFSGVAIGYTAAEYMIDGTNGVFIGANAAGKRRSAQRSIFIGKSAGEITSNSANVDIKTGTGGAAAGADNVGIGYASLWEFLGSRVTAVGTNSGANLIGSPDFVSDSVFLGFNSGNHLLQKKDVRNSIALGAASYTDDDNQLSLGNDELRQVKSWGFYTFEREEPNDGFGVTNGSLFKGKHGSLFYRDGRGKVVNLSSFPGWLYAVLFAQLIINLFWVFQRQIRIYFSAAIINRR